jgi:hypothetical protein
MEDCKHGKIKMEEERRAEKDYSYGKAATWKESSFTGCARYLYPSQGRYKPDGRFQQQRSKAEMHGQPPNNGFSCPRRWYK